MRDRRAAGCSFREGPCLRILYFLLGVKQDGGGGATGPGEVRRWSAVSRSTRWNKRDAEVGSKPWAKMRREMVWQQSSTASVQGCRQGLGHQDGIRQDTIETIRLSRAYDQHQFPLLPSKTQLRFRCAAACETLVWGLHIDAYGCCHTDGYPDEV